MRPLPSFFLRPELSSNSPTQSVHLLVTSPAMPPISNRFMNLPPELVSYILEELSYKDLLSCKLVSTGCEVRRSQEADHSHRSVMHCIMPYPSRRLCCTRSTLLLPASKTTSNILFVNRPSEPSLACTRMHGPGYPSFLLVNPIA